uniref:Uncharacterized protein n=1 Tax=Arundo donax TaxID=35708 RepID=A0A0A8YDZ0_ARUDO
MFESLARAKIPSGQLYGSCIRAPYGTLVSLLLGLT